MSLIQIRMEKLKNQKSHGKYPNPKSVRHSEGERGDVGWGGVVGFGVGLTAYFLA